MNLLVVLACLQVSLGLNIVLTSTDSWVSNNVRYLYHELSKNHTVILTGSLYNHQFKYIDDISDGGDFNHLLPINQIYYNNVAQINKKSRGAFGGYGVDGPSVGAKGVIFGLKDLHPLKSEEALIKNQFFGQDPQDSNVWYINDHSLNSLVKTFDIILPTYYPDFTPDLIVVSSNEVDEEDLPDYNQLMMDFGLYKGLTTLLMSSQSSNHLYYKDEITNQNQFKLNFLKWKIKYINHKILQIISLLNIDTPFGIKVNLPNTDSSHKCHRTKPKFLQINSSLRFESWEVPKFTFVNNQLKSTDSTPLSRETKQVIQSENSLTISDILDNCNISMEIVDSETNNISKDQFDLQYNLSLQPEPRFRKRTWRRFFKLRFYKRKLRYLFFKLTTWD